MLTATAVPSGLLFGYREHVDLTTYLVALASGNPFWQKRRGRTSHDFRGHAELEQRLSRPPALCWRSARNFGSRSSAPLALKMQAHGRCHDVTTSSFWAASGAECSRSSSQPSETGCSLLSKANERRPQVLGDLCYRSRQLRAGQMLRHASYLRPLYMRMTTCASTLFSCRISTACFGGMLQDVDNPHIIAASSEHVVDVAMVSAVDAVMRICFSKQRERSW